MNVGICLYTTLPRGSKLSNELMTVNYLSDCVELQGVIFRENSRTGVSKTTVGTRVVSGALLQILALYP